MSITSRIARVAKESTAHTQFIEATVISESPLKLQVKGNDKWIIPGTSIIVPEHLSDYERKIEILEKTVSGQTKSAAVEGSSHSHGIEDIDITNLKIKVFNSLKVGQVVMCISFNFGQRYYIIDRVGD